MDDLQPSPSVVIASEQISARRFIDFQEYMAAADTVKSSIESVIDA